MYRNFRVHLIDTPSNDNLPPPLTTTTSDFELSSSSPVLFDVSSPTKAKKRVRNPINLTTVKRVKKSEKGEGEEIGVEREGEGVRLWIEYEVGIVARRRGEEGERGGLKWLVGVRLEKVKGKEGWELILETYPNQLPPTELTDTGEPQLGPKFTSLSRQSFPLSLPFKEVSGSDQLRQVSHTDSREKESTRYKPKLFNFEVISDSLEEPLPAVIIGWYCQPTDSIKRLERLEYFQFSIHSLITTSPTWSIINSSTISTSLTTTTTTQLNTPSPLSTLLIDGPAFYLTSNPPSSPYPDCQLLRWDILNQSLQLRIMESSLPPLGWLNFNHTDYLIHPHLLTRREAKLMATATTEFFPTDSDPSLEPYLPLTGGKKWWKEFELKVPQAHQVTSLMMEWFPESSGNLPFRVQGWVGLKEGLIKPFGVANPPTISSIPLDAPPHSLTWSKDQTHLIAVTRSACHIIPLDSPITSAPRLDFPNLSFASHYSNNEVGIYSMDFEGKRGHPILFPLTRKDHHSSQHPILERVQNRLMDRCQEESLQLSERRSLLLRKLKLIHDGLELLRNVGHELTTRPELPLTPYPPLAPLLPTSRTLRSYYPLPDMMDDEVELDPALKLPSLPLAQRLRSEFDGDFSNSGLTLGQYWIRVKVTNLHCEPLYNLRLNVSLSPHLHGTPGLIESLRYWNPGLGASLPPNVTTHLFTHIRVIQIPSGHTLDQIWSLLTLTTSWDERISSQLRSTTHRVNLPPSPTSSLRIDHLPLPTIVLTIPSPSSSFTTLPSFLLTHPSFTFTHPDPTTPHLVTSPTAGLSLLLRTPAPPEGHPSSLHIKGIHTGILYQFLITLVNHYRHHHHPSTSPSPSSDTTSPAPTLQFLPTLLINPATTLPHSDSDSEITHRLLTYLMALI